MVAIARIVAGLDDVSEKFVVEALAGAIEPSWVDAALRQSGRESRRSRLLPATFALWAVVLLGLFRRHSYVNLLQMLRGSLWAQRHWPSEAVPTSSALTQARDRLGAEPLRLLFRQSAQCWQREMGGMRVAGLRLMAIDGSTARTPDSDANRAHFGLPASSQSPAAFPMLRMVALLDVGSRLTCALNSGPFSAGELTLARPLLSEVPPDALVVVDRGFGSYAFLWDPCRRGAHFVARVKRWMKAQTVRRLGPGDRLVRVRPHYRLRRDRPDLPAEWILREIVYTPRRGHEAVRIFTGLVDPALAPAHQLAGAYGLRWEHETAFDEIKTHLLDRTTANRPVFFRSMTPERVEQELYGAFVAHNVVRLLLGRAAKGDARDPRRLSFVAGLERIREAVRDMMAMPTLRLPDRHDRLLHELRRVVVPERPNRSNRREVKINGSHYPRKKTRRAA